MERSCNQKGIRKSIMSITSGPNREAVNRNDIISIVNSFMNDLKLAEQQGDFEIFDDIPDKRYKNQAYLDRWERFKCETKQNVDAYILKGARKKLKLSEHQDVFRNKIDIKNPYLSKIMKVEINIKHLYRSTPHDDPDLLNIIIEKNFIDCLEDINVKWGKELRSDTVDTLCQTILSMESCHPINLYPNYFVRLIDITEHFFSLLDKRVNKIKRISETNNFDDHIILIDNWNIKILSKNEISPRIMCKVGLIPIYSKIKQYKAIDYLILTYQLRGVSNLIFFMYMAVYYVRTLNLHQFSHLEKISREFLDQAIYRLSDDDWLQELKNLYKNFEMSDCFSLIAPCLKYIMYYAIKNSKSDVIDQLLLRFEKIKSPLITEVLVDSIPIDALFNKIDYFISNICELDMKGYSTASTVVCFVRRLMELDTKKINPQILDKLWSLISTYTDIHEYLTTNIYLIPFALMFKNLKVVNKMLCEINAFLKKDVSSYTLYTNEIKNIIDPLYINLDSHDIMRLNELPDILNSIHDPLVVLDCAKFLLLKISKDLSEFNGKNESKIVFEYLKICNNNFRVSLDGKLLISLENIFIKYIKMYKYPTDFDGAISSLEYFRSCLSKYMGVYKALVLISFDLMIKLGIFYHDNLQDKYIRQFFLFIQILVIPLYNTPFGINKTIKIAELSSYIIPIYSFPLFKIVRLQLEGILNGNIQLQSNMLDPIVTTFLLCCDRLPILHEFELNFHQFIYKFIQSVPIDLADKWRVRKLAELLFLLVSYDGENCSLTKLQANSLKMFENDKDLVKELTLNVIRTVDALLPSVTGLYSEDELKILNQKIGNCRKTIEQTYIH